MTPAAHHTTGASFLPGVQEKGRVFRESFLSKLQLLLRGTVAAPPERFGETLADEHIRGECNRAGQVAELCYICHPPAVVPVMPALQWCPGCNHLCLNSARCAGGAFVGPDNKPVIVSEHLPNAHMRLFGGAQYHRAMAEFRAGARALAGWLIDWLTVQHKWQHHGCLACPCGSAAGSAQHWCSDVALLVAH